MVDWNDRSDLFPTWANETDRLRRCWPSQTSRERHSTSRCRNVSSSWSSCGTVWRQGRFRSLTGSVVVAGVGRRGGEGHRLGSCPGRRSGDPLLAANSRTSEAGHGQGLPGAEGAQARVVELAAAPCVEPRGNAPAYTRRVEHVPTGVVNVHGHVHCNELPRPAATSTSASSTPITGPAAAGAGSARCRTDRRTHACGETTLDRLRAIGALS